jgi:molybdate transport system ATP-binding protein
VPTGAQRSRKEARPLLALRGASVRLGERLVFRNTDWTIRRGEHWVLVGPNGSGKTVLCAALCGEHPIAGGSIEYGFRGDREREPEQCIERLSFDPAGESQSPDGVPVRWFSLDLENSPTVAAVLSREGIEGINPFEVVCRKRGETRLWNRLYRRVVRLTGVEAFLGQPLLSLSNGEHRKVMLARALLRRPRVLILDDPFLGLDVRYRRHLGRIVEQLIRRRHVTILLISSRPREWPRGMTHLALVDRLRIAKSGPLRAMRRDQRMLRLLEAPGQVQEALVSAAQSGLRTGWHPSLPGKRPLSRQGGAGATRTEAKKRPAGQAQAGRCAPPGNELIRLRDVRVTWDRKTILDGVTWTVRENESWAIVGPNGAGKSTLLSLVLGEHPQAYSNDVSVFGKRRGEGVSVWELKRRLGWVSPEFHMGFDVSLTGLEAVVTGFFDTSVLNSAPAAAQRAAARVWLRKLGCSRLAGRVFGEMSTGEQRLVLLARALVKRPRLLVLDEPCQGLDRHSRSVFVEAVDRQIRGGATALYVTHQADEVPPAIRRVLHLRNGRARAE